MTQERQRQLVAACCARAAEAGVRVGMPLTQARALFPTPDVRIETHRPSTDAAALDRIAVWAQRLSPVVAIDEPHGLLLDVTGCAPVWGGEDRLLRAALTGLERIGFAARAAIAPTFGCAWAVSRFGSERACLVPADGIRDALAPLPISALRVDGGVAVQLAEVGIERVDDLLELPRSTLPARFGSELLLRLDQALGQAIETIEPVRPVPPPAVERVFDGPTDRIEPIEHMMRELLSVIAAELVRRSCGALRLDVELARSDLNPERLSITLGRPSQDARHLWQLLRPKIDRAHLGFGVEGVGIRVGEVGRIKHIQAEHSRLAGDTSERHTTAGEVELATTELLDTLSNRLGSSRVLRAELRESRLPERAFVMQPASDRRETIARPAPGSRPTKLFNRPSPAEVIALTPNGPVHRLTWRGEEHEVTACIGPERIGGEWWRTHPAQPDRTRDYFAVRDKHGRWLWLGRGVESGRWFVHGIWA